MVKNLALRKDSMIGLIGKLPRFLFRKATLVQTCLATQPTPHFVGFNLESAGNIQGKNLADTTVFILDAQILTI